MPLYEHVFLARQDLAQAQVDALAENATKIIEDNGGKVVKTETWGLRNLAYRIAKNRKAHYVALDFDAPRPGRRRAGAPDPDQRGRDPLHDRQGRRARAGPVGDDAPRRARQARGDDDRGDRGDRGDRNGRGRDDYEA